MEPNSRSSGMQHIIEFANFRLDPKKRKLCTLNGNQLVLNSRAFDTLLVLVEHQGKVLSKHQLLDAVWPKAVVEENNLNQAISALRKVLGDSNDNNRIILTIPGRGFCFVAEIRQAADKSAGNVANMQLPGAVNDSSPLPDAQNLIPIAQSTTLPRPLNTNIQSTKVSGTDFAKAGAENSRTVRKLQIGVVLVAFIIIAAALALWTRVPPPGPPPRLAILMFGNLSPDPENAFFAEGLHSEILSTLANRLSGMQVISLTTMRMYRNSDKSLQTIAGELNATHILEGAVFREGNRMRLTLQLIDGSTDELLWSERYERTLTDALPLQAEVANAIASQLVVQLIDVIDAPTTDAVAYDLYLKARVARMYLTGSHPVEEWRRAETLLGEALERDPAFWRAYVERAYVRHFMALNAYTGTSSSAALATADLAAARAIAGDEPLILAAEAEAEPDPDRALQLFETAEAGGLGEAEIFWGKAGRLVTLRRWPEALALHERTILLDPGNSAAISIAWFHFLYARQAEQAYRFMNGLYVTDTNNFQWRMQRAQTIFMFTGNTDLWKAFPFTETAPGFMDDGTQAYEIWKQMRFTGEFDDLKNYFDALSANAVRNLGISHFMVFSIKETPTAEFRGWSRLFIGDSDSAVKEGRAILDYVARRQASPTDAWYVSLLTAEGLLFIDEKERAIDEVHKALELAANTGHDITLAAARTQAAAILAWSGAENEASVLLETLADGTPGLPPALVTRDPLFYIPLAANQRYKSLTARLEAEMAARTFE